MLVLWDWDPDFLAALQTSGLMSPADGVKLRQAPLAGAAAKFNEQLADGSELREWVLGSDRPFAVDRGVGGTNYDPYPWDHELLDEVAGHLGGRFLGVQIHEWTGNVSSDVRRIRDLGLDSVAAGPYGGRPAHAGGRPRLQYGMKDQYAGCALPTGPAAFLDFADEAFTRKRADFGGYAYLVEGHDQSYARAFALGARAGMAEVGQQVPLASLQVACLRGAARWAGKPWGLYYEPWGSGACTHYGSRSLWGRPAALTYQDRALGHGGHSGSSRALQRRLLYYGLVCGAHFVADEYGYENTFWNPPSPALTPYGLAQKDAIELGRRHDFGESWRPILIVVADRYWPLRTRDVVAGAFSGWGTFAVDPPTAPVLDTLRRCFLGAVEIGELGRGDESRTLPAPGLPDVFDVVPASAASIAADYQMVVYCGPDGEEATRCGRDDVVWADEAGADGVASRVGEFLSSRAPAQVDGDVFVTINKVDRSWLIGLFNPHGVTRSAERGDVRDATQSRDVTIAAGGAAFGEWASQPEDEPIRVEGGAARVRVSAGGVRLIELTPPGD